MTINVMFINNLFNLAINAKIICFADDTVILLFDKSFKTYILRQT